MLNMLLLQAFILLRCFAYHVIKSFKFSKVGGCFLGSRFCNPSNNSYLYGSTNHGSDSKSKRTLSREGWRLSSRLNGSRCNYCHLFCIWITMVRCSDSFIHQSSTIANKRIGSKCAGRTTSISWYSRTTCYIDSHRTLHWIVYYDYSSVGNYSDAGIVWSLPFHGCIVSERTSVC